MKKITVALLIALSFILTDVGEATAFEYPKYDGYVNDFAEIMSPEEEIQLEDKLSAYDKSTTNQIVVVTIKSLDGQIIEEYSIGLAEEWAPGTEQDDNGLIFLMALEDREMRIEVGQGLEGEVTDLESKYILDDIVAPEFKKGQYNQGIASGIDAIILSIDSEIATASATTDKEEAFMGILILMFIIAFVIALIITEGGGGSFGSGLILGSILSEITKSDSSSSGGTSFGGGGFSGGGSSSSW